MVTGVQSLVDSGIHKLPEQYVRPQDERPEKVVGRENLSIPIIDLGKLDGPNPDRASTLLAIHEACKDWGFFQVVNHGVPTALMKQTKELAEEFFALPLEEKQKFKPQPGVHRSVGTFGSSFNPSKDKILDWRDVLRQFFATGWESDTGSWPQRPPLYKETLIAYRNAVTDLANRLIDVMAENLGLPSGYFNQALGSCQQHVHFVCYPKCPEPQLALGIKSHADSGILTILQQDEVGGLQVSKDGQWIFVEPVPDAFVINLGDAMQVVTNDLYPSVDHRAVVNELKTRFSLVTFHTPEANRMLTPAPALVSAEHPALYGEFTFGDYINAVFSNGLDGKNTLAKFRSDWSNR
eukprot:TRINITY_DN14118_c0_g1_i1.p1 TRINITY_DN14118_c0_g1~~TRINITY_DN14118_c0_g1_i1.p1  ORF type:complete len:365 (+),score=62.51 TRINITY_DN14118_c0_g1_i1:45-1097(+)